MSDSNAKTDPPDGFPKTQDELNKIIDSRLAPKLARITELEGQVTSLTGEKEALTGQVSEKDQTIGQLQSTVSEKSKELLVTQVAHTKGVPAKWLSGEDQSALEASADEWLADAKGIASASPTGTANPGTGDGDNGGEQPGQQAGGYVGSAGTGSEEPARPSFEERKQAAYERASKQRKGVLTS